MNDFLPPKRPLSQQTPARPAIAAPKEEQKLEPGEMPLLLTETTPLDKKPRSVKKIVLIVLAILFGLLVVAAAAVYMWYQSALSPLDPGNTNRTRIQVVEGSSPSQIGQLLEEQKIIRSGVAFDIYTRLTNTRSVLQAGSYNLSPSESVSQVVDHMASGRVDELTLTFLPGATLTDPSDTPEAEKTDVQSVLLRAGFSQAEIDAAFIKTYDHPLFTGKPADTNLEGYIYGETYKFDSSTTVEQVLEKTFDEYYAVIEENDLVNAFKKQGLSLYQGITLASIIQREVPTPTDQKQVAQVFFTRLKMDMELGSDVTYQYAAKMKGVAPTPELNSPYNTRKFKGLPPGPIAMPGLTALQAVAHPASGDFVYFLSGDDDITYFARTFEQHEKNIVDHCKIKCSTN